MNIQEKIEKELRTHNIHEVFSKTIIKYIAELSRHVRITGVILHGSVARRKAHPRHSDIDLIIVSPDFDIPYTKIVDLRRRIAKYLPGGVDALWLGEKEILSVFKGFTGVLLDALYDGIILFDEKGLLKSLKGKLMRAIETGITFRRYGMWKIPGKDWEVLVDSP